MKNKNKESLGGDSLELLRNTAKELSVMRKGYFVEFHYQRMSEIQLLVDARINFMAIKWGKSHEDILKKVNIYNIIYLRRYGKIQNKD